MLYRLIICMCIWFTMFAGNSYAAVAMWISDVEQAKISKAVVVAKVGSSNVVNTDNGLRTVFQLQVEQVISGSAPSSIEMIVYGGTTTNNNANFHGNIELSEGERCVLFLFEQDNKWYATALQQSKYLIVEDPHYGEILTRNIDQLLVYKNDENNLEDYVESLPQPVLTLNNFIDMMKEEVR